ncbi:MAG: MaoC family dehydratase [Steroidobacteraceae bacterium]
MTTHSISGPSFEDFTHGLEFDAPAVTIDAGQAAWHQALFGDRLRLPLDHHTSTLVTGARTAMVHPLLAINIAIGQSTWASQRVKANLFYRGLILHRSVHLGDTLYTRTKVVGLRQNKSQTNRAATGIVALEMTTTNQRGETVLHFWRCPMIPCRNPAATTGHADDLEQIGNATTQADVIAALPRGWNLKPTESWLGWRHDTINVGDQVIVEARDTVTSAPELVRLSLNMAMAHTDSAVSYLGERLVFGGHIIFTCFAQITRALPNLLTLIAWENCDHLAPVIEGDRLRTTFYILDRISVTDGGALLRIAAKCHAARGTPETETTVLDWTFWAWSA